MRPARTPARLPALLGIAATAVTLSACSGEDPADAAAAGTTVTASAVAGPCDTLEPADVESAYGVEVAEADSGVTIGGSNDTGWTVPTCAWTAGEAFQFEVGLADAAAFDSGEVSCPELISIGIDVETEMVEVAGVESAQWRLGEALGSTPGTEGHLRVCTPEMMIEVTVEFADDGAYDDDPRDATIGLAEQIAAQLS